MSDDEDQPRRSRGQGGKMAYALQNGTGAIIARLMIIVGVPALLTISAFAGNRLVGQLDRLADKLDREAEKVETHHEEDVKATNRLDVRVTGAEHDIADLRARIR